MNLPSVLLLVLLALAVGLTLRALWKHRGRGCGGCHSCTGCPHRGRCPDQNNDVFP